MTHDSASFVLCTVSISQPVFVRMVAAVAVAPCRVTKVRMPVSLRITLLQTIGKGLHSHTNVMYAINGTSTKRICGYIIVSTQVTLALNVIYVTRPFAKVDILQHTNAHTQGRNHTNVMYAIKTFPRKATCKDIIVYTLVTSGTNVKCAVKLLYRMVN